MVAEEAAPFLLEERAKMAEYDLTSKVGQYLDRHLVFPLIEFLSGKEVSIYLSDFLEAELAMFYGIEFK